ncbi:MAG: hypothetical protein M1812_006209 [Candelaria pacifica]|nr:MAG: hypothetical protein M1812_006209 [Candelaria pacifica]
MRVNAAAVLLVSLIPCTLAVFADEAYHTDYHHALLGIPHEQRTFFHRPSSSSKASLLYTLSEKGILGAVNPKDGTIVWRQALTPTSSSSVAGHLRAGEAENSVISAVGGEVRAWDALDGKLVWGDEFADGPIKDLEVLELVDGTEGSAKDAIVLFGEGMAVVRRIKGGTGAVVWEYRDDSGDVPFQVSTSASSIYYISLHSGLRSGNKIKITSLDPITGRQTSQYTLNSDSDVSSPSSVLFVGANSASPIVVWSDKALKTLKVNVLGSRNIKDLDIAHQGSGEIEKITIHAPHLTKARSHFLAHYQTSTSNWADVFHIDLSSSTVGKEHSLPNVAGKGAFSTSTEDANVFFTRITETELIIVSSVSHGILGRWSLESYSLSSAPGKESPLHAISEVVSKPDSTYAVRCAMTISSGNWELVRNGESIWTRTEALAGVVAATWAELNEREDLAQQLAAEVHANILGAYVHRVKRHVKDLEYFPAWLQALPRRFMGSFLGEMAKVPEDGLHRDNFGFRKLAIVATENGHLTALDVAAHGRLIWNIRAVRLAEGGKWNVSSISVTDGQIAVKAHDGHTMAVEALTGKVVTNRTLGQSAATAGEAPKAEATQGILDDRVTTISREKNGDIIGVRHRQSDKTVTGWHFKPSAGERVVDVLTRPSHDPVASIGKVLGDRSVMYKYLNPNIVLITTVSDAAKTATFSLLNSVSGAVLHSTTHTGVDITRPIVSAMSENWFVYSLWCDVTNSPTTVSAAKGYQLGVTELYESDMPNDRGPLGSATNYSSIDPSSITSAYANPHVISQAFLVPEEISHMAVTQTGQGITSRQLLCTLPSSNSIIGIPYSVFDARRPIGRDATAAEAEEGLFRYTPNIEFDPKWMITHQLEVLGVNKIITSPALLESTSLVFAYGIDIFGTRVAPSMAFDILNKGFGKLSLVGTVVALGVGVALLAPMVRRKQINGIWQA